MKRILLFALVLFSLDAAAQLEISGNYGYRTGGKVDVFYNNELGYIRLNDSESFGVDLNYQLNPGFSVELQWFGQDTRMDFYGFNNLEIETLGDIWINYFMVNGIYEKEVDRVTPYAGIGIGMTTAVPDDRRLDSQYFFAANLQAGAKFALSERISLKIRAAMLMPLQFGSGGLFCGTGSGCSVGVGASTSIIQGDFGGGVVVKLGDTGQTSHTPSQSSSPTW